MNKQSNWSWFLRGRVLLVVAVFSLSLCSITLNVAPVSAAGTTKYLNGKILVAESDGIYSMRADGSQKMQIIAGNDAHYSASWSPDGSKIVFMSNQDDPNHEIYTINADGTGLERLTNNNVYDDYPAWSPDGSKILFESERGGQYSIFTMNPDGSQQTRLTGMSYWAYGATWSPDGSKVLFSAEGDDADGHLNVINADGSNKQQLLSIPGGSDYPSWSPDGSKIVFNTNDGDREIYTMNADGSNLIRLTDNTYTDLVGAWSPDGSKILFESNLGGTAKAYTMNADGSNIQEIAEGAITQSVYAASPWQALPYTQSVVENGVAYSVIEADANYSHTDYAVSNNEVLTLNGSLGQVVIDAGGTLKGTGTAGELLVKAGAKLAPGNSPGCFTAGNTTLSGIFEAEIGGSAACSGHDQLVVNGSVDLSGATLEARFIQSFKASPGQNFILIVNDGTDPIVGTFSNLQEGAILELEGVQMQISYVGGDGNDAVLTVLATSIKPPNTGYEPNDISVLLASLAGSGLVFVAHRRFMKMRGE